MVDINDLTEKVQEVANNDNVITDEEQILLDEINNFIRQYKLVQEDANEDGIVDEEEKALNVSSSMIPLEDPGLFFVFGIVNRGVGPDALESAVNEEIRKVRNNLISDQEFQKIRNQIQDQFYSGRNSVRSKATQLARYHLLYGNANLINTEIERYMDVTKKDLKRVANEYLVPENRTVLYYLPKSQKQVNQ